MSKSSPIRTVIAGATGRMGRVLMGRVLEDPSFELTGITEAPGHPKLGEDVGTILGQTPLEPVLTANVADAASASDAFIDFTSPKATLAAAAVLRNTSVKALIVGTTGFTESEEADLRRHGDRFAIVKAGNFSLGVNLLAALTRYASARLGRDWDIEILETHHRHKVDAPSGTALMLGEAAAQGRVSELSPLRLAPHDGITGPRPDGGIGFAVRRSGGVVGDHEVTLASDAEIITLGHQALDRSVFARGALHAASWALDRAPGNYAMEDVLGL